MVRPWKVITNKKKGKKYQCVNQNNNTDGGHGQPTHVKALAHLLRTRAALRILALLVTGTLVQSGRKRLTLTPTPSHHPTQKVRRTDGWCSAASTTRGVSGATQSTCMSISLPSMRHFAWMPERDCSRDSMSCPRTLQLFVGCHNLFSRRD